MSWKKTEICQGRKEVKAAQLADAVAQSVGHLPGVDAENVKALFLSMVGKQDE